MFVPGAIMKKSDSLRKEVGQLFQLGLSGTMLSKEQRSLFSTYPPGALRITPFVSKFIPQKESPPSKPVSNLTLAETYQAVSHLIYDACGSPPIIREGMEGGEWNCLVQDRFPVAPMFMGWANHNDPALTYRVFSELARAESSMGLRCSDVLVDINFDRRNAAMGNRTLGSNLPLINSQAAIMIRALEDHGVIPVLKHFPCQSYGSTDTHFKTMRVELTIREMEKSVLIPYRELLKDKYMLMLSHAMIPAVDKKLPTTLSRAVVTGLLRERLGFDGPIMTDSITMASILDLFPIPEACVMSILAGADQILLKAEDFFGPSVRAVEAAVRSGRISRKRLEASLHRLHRVKEHYGVMKPFRASEERIEASLHSAQAQEFWETASRAITRVMREAKGDLPLRPRRGERWLVIENDEGFLDRHCHDEWHHRNILADNLKERFPHVRIEKRFIPYCDKIEEGRKFIAGAVNFDRVIAGIYSTRIKHSPLGVSLALGKAGIRHIAVINNPFNADPGRLPKEAQTVICPFGFFRFPIRGAVAMLAGDIPLNSQVRPDLAANKVSAWQEKI
jgi:beta-N-acetylhexosaminidase